MKMKSDVQSSLPDLWVWTTLQDVGDIYSGGTPSTKNSSYFEGDIPWITPADLSGYKKIYISTGKRNISQEAVNSSSAVLIPAGSVLFSSRAPIGYVAIAKNEFTTNQGFKSIKPLGGISSGYIYYYLKTIKDLAEAEASGTTFLEISKSKFERLPLPLAPLPEQYRIVAKIEELFTQLDASEAALKRAKANLERYRRSVLQAAVTGDLTKIWVEENRRNLAPVDEVVERLEIERKKKWENDLIQKGRDPRKATYQKPTAPNKSILPALPTGWDWVSVSQVGDINEQPVLTGPFGSTLGQGDFMDRGVPVLTIGCLTDAGLSLDKAMYIHADKALELDRYRVRSGDMLFSRMASVGRAGLVTPPFEGAIINYHLMRLRLASAVISPSYFVYFVKGSTTVQDYVREVNHGATRDGINTEQLSGLPIALPPLEEQEEIVRKIEEYLSFKEYEQSVIDQSLKRISRLRQSILEEAFQGRLVDQKPEDEPASVLLQRVQAERAEREKQQAAKPKKEKKKVTEEQKRKPLVETLHAAGARLTPQELFRRAGFDEECVDEFYEELRQELQIEVDGNVVKPGRIKEERPNQAVIYLSEVKA